MGRVPTLAPPGESDWDTGLCGAYAVALKERYPHLRLGACGCLSDDGWIAQHYFAHDDTYLYDSAGARLLTDVLRDDVGRALDYPSIEAFEMDWGECGEAGDANDLAEARRVLARG